VTFTFTGAMPAAVATKVGSGAYTQATPESGKVSISVPSGETNYAVAYLCPPVTGDNPPESSEIVYQASTQDATTLTGGCNEPSTTTPQTGLATVEVNAAAFPAGDWVFVEYGGWPWSSSTLSISDEMAVGTYDIPVYVTGQSFNDFLAIKILREQTIPGALNGGNPVVFEAGDAVTTQTITYNNIPNGFTANSPMFSYETAGGAYMILDFNGPPTQYVAMPTAAYQSGDYYWISVRASTNASPSSGVSVDRFTPSGGPETFTFPASWPYAGPTAAALPTFNFSYAGFSGMPDVGYGAYLRWQQGTASSNYLDMFATANYLNGSTSMTIPDLSGLTGFLAPAASGTSVSWSALISQGNPYLTTPPSGNQQSVGNGGTYTEP
jgi:hypothetical protein